MATKIPAPPLSIGRQLNFTTGRANALCEKMLAPHGLSLPQWAILSCLWRNGELTVGTLSELVGTGLPATSRIVERMVERGLITRRRDSADARISVVGLTSKGRALDKLADFFETINDKLLAGFNDEERALSFELLRRMERNARNELA